MKGISPLIASVILIAVTLAIAGILSTWAFQFIGRTQAGITTRTECIGALNIATPPSLSYSNGNLTLVMINTKSTLSLENMTAFMTFEDGKTRTASLGDLAPLGIDSTVITGLPSKPINLKITSANCEGVFLADTAIP